MKIRRGRHRRFRRMSAGTKWPQEGEWKGGSLGDLMTNCVSELNDVASTDEVEWPREPKQGVFQGIGVRHLSPVHWELLGAKSFVFTCR